MARTSLSRAGAKPKELNRLANIYLDALDKSPVPVIAAGELKARNLREALDTMAAVIEAGGLGATIGRNVWGVKPVTEALGAFKAVILDRVSPATALEVVGLTGSE